MNTAQLKKYFSKTLLTKKHQTFIYDLATKIEDEKAQQDIINFLLSDDFVRFQIKLAKQLNGYKSEEGAVVISKMVILLMVNIITGPDEDERDEFGFQI